MPGLILTQHTLAGCACVVSVSSLIPKGTAVWVSPCHEPVCVYPDNIGLLQHAEYDWTVVAVG